MRHVTPLLAYFIFLEHFLTISSEPTNTSKVIDTLNVNDIADALVATLGVYPDDENYFRLRELKEKLAKIDTYTIDKEKYALLLTNVTMETDLNETNFYKSLSEDEHFKFLSNHESKSLYMKLKERMNRDDILKILVEKGEKSNIVKSARKSMDVDLFGATDSEDIVDTVVDKILAEAPSDNHKYKANINDSKYWDPQGELEDIVEYHAQNGRRIFRGERTTIKYYPFMVSISVMGRFWCGGAIYWHDLVITSAACLQLMHNNRFFRENPKILQIRVGSNHSRISGELVEALEVYFHPSYNPHTLENNIAIIRLRRHLNFNYHRVPKIIDISHNPSLLPSTAEVLLLGWGVRSISQKLAYEPIFLQRKVLPVYPNKFCKEIYGDKFITQTMFCAGTFTTGEGACDHDAGGPAILSGKLVGIISFGPVVCGFPNAPTVFTLVGAYSDWIETVNETMPGYYQGRARTTSSTMKPLFHYLETMYTRPSNTLPSSGKITLQETTVKPGLSWGTCRSGDINMQMSLKDGTPMCPMTSIYLQNSSDVMESEPLFVFGDITDDELIMASITTTARPTTTNSTSTSTTTMTPMVKDLQTLFFQSRTETDYSNADSWDDTSVENKL